MAEYTDEQIKKALECCVKSTHFGECFENKCPMVSEDGCAVGKETLYPYALDLINRQETEKAELQDEIKCEKETNKHLNDEYIALLKKCNCQEAEIERLKKEVKELTENSISAKFSHRVLCSRGVILTKDLTQYDELIADISAEAIKAFAGKSQKELYIEQDEHRKHWEEHLKNYRGTAVYGDHERAVDNWLRGYGEAVQDILSIEDNLTKEMVGESDV